MKKNQRDYRAAMLAKYMIRTKKTVREIAKDFGISKSTVFADIAYRLPNYAPMLAERAQEILNINKEERAQRGGLATKRKYNK